MHPDLRRTEPLGGRTRPTQHAHQWWPTTARDGRFGLWLDRLLLPLSLEEPGWNRDGRFREGGLREGGLREGRLRETDGGVAVLP